MPTWTRSGTGVRAGSSRRECREFAPGVRTGSTVSSRWECRKFAPGVPGVRTDAAASGDSSSFVIQFVLRLCYGLCYGLIQIPEPESKSRSRIPEPDRVLQTRYRKDQETSPLVGCPRTTLLEMEPESKSQNWIPEPESKSRSRIPDWILEPDRVLTGFVVDSNPVLVETDLIYDNHDGTSYCHDCMNCASCLPETPG